MNLSEQTLASFYQQKFLRSTYDIQDYLRSLPTAREFKEDLHNVGWYSVELFLAADSKIILRSDGRVFFVTQLKKRL